MARGGKKRKIPSETIQYTGKKICKLELKLQQLLHEFDVSPGQLQLLFILFTHWPSIKERQYDIVFKLIEDRQKGIGPLSYIELLYQLKTEGAKH